MKCVICGNEIGTNKFCTMCGAENFGGGTSNQVAPNGQMYGGHGDVAYASKSILTANPAQQEAGTTILTAEQLDMAYQDTNHSVAFKNTAMDETPKPTGKQKSVIPQYEKPKSKKELKKDEKEKKKKQGFKKAPFIITICILSVIVVALTIVLLYYIFRVKKEYIELAPEQDSVVLLYDRPGDAFVTADDEKILNVSEAYAVSQDGSAAIFYKDGVLSQCCLDGTNQDFGSVDNFYVNDALSSVVCVNQTEDGCEVIFFHNGKKYFVENGLQSVNEVVISDSGDYFSFYNMYDEVYWEENERLEEGGQYITIVHRELYVVNYNGESKKVYTSEDEELHCNYITNEGKVFLSLGEEGKGCVFMDDELEKLDFTIENVLFYENVDEYIVLTKEHSLCYGTLDGQEDGHVIATGIESFYDIAGNQNKNEFDQTGSWNLIVGNAASYADMVKVVYNKNSSSYFVCPESMSESVKLTDKQQDLTGVYAWHNEKIFYILKGKLYMMYCEQKEEAQGARTEVITTWYPATIVHGIKDGSLRLTLDGKAMFLNDENTLFCYGNKECTEIEQDVDMFAVSDLSDAFCYASADKLYYAYGVFEEGRLELADVGSLGYLDMTNRNVYYYDTVSKDVSCFHVATMEQETYLTDVTVSSEDLYEVIKIVRGEER